MDVMAYSSLDDLTDYLNLKAKKNGSSTRSRHSIKVLACSVVVLIIMLFIYSVLTNNQKSLFLSKHQTVIKPVAAVYSCTPCMADIDKNNIVGEGDVAALSLCMNKTIEDTDAFGSSCATSDLNGDGVIDNADLECIKMQFYKSCTE